MAALVIVAVAGCGPSGGGKPDASGTAGAGGGGGGSGGNGGGGGSAGATSGGVVTWNENGTPHTATVAGGSRVRSAASDTIQIVGADAAGTAVTLDVATPVPPLTPGSFACGSTSTADPIVSIAYTNSGGGQMPTCTIVISTLGDTTGSHATGTFNATVPLRSGGTATITNGVFDVTLTVTNL